MRASTDLNRAGNNSGFLRLVFAALVVLAHSSELLDNNRSREVLTNVFGTVSSGELAVDGFFLISGYLITNSWEKSSTASTYLFKRVLRIYPGFIVAFLISLLVVGPIAGGDITRLAGIGGPQQFLSILFLSGPRLDGAFRGLPYSQLNGSMWTIA